MISIHQQLRKSFVFVAVLSVLVIFVLSNIGMVVFFQLYVHDADLKSDQKVAQYLEDLLGVQENGKAIATIPGLMQFVQGEQVVIKVYDASGGLMLDSSLMGRGMPGMMGQGMMGSGMGNNPRLGESQIGANELVFHTYPLLEDGKSLGSVEIGREKTILSTTENRGFIVTMNAVFLLALGLALLFAMVTSKRVTKQFLHPLLQVKTNLSSIPIHGSKHLVPISAQTVEILELARTIESLAKAIEEQERLRKRLTSDLAHELRTPLATLQSHLEAMVDGIWEATPQRLSFCNDEVIRLTRLISDLSELSVLENDRIQLKKEKVDLSTLLEVMVENYRLIFAEKQIALEGNISPNITMVGERDRLRQILVNILSNANKYTPLSGKVTVDLKQEANTLLIEIKDSGKGISPLDLPHVYERFYRGDLSRSRGTGGTGIGLTIARALVEAHQGTMLIESELGQGTSVQIRFPTQEPV